MGREAAMGRDAATAAPAGARARDLGSVWAGSGPATAGPALAGAWAAPGEGSQPEPARLLSVLPRRRPSRARVGA